MSTAREGQIAALVGFADAVVSARDADAIADALVAAAHRIIGVDQVHLTEVSQDATVGHSRATAFNAAGPVSDRYVQVFEDQPSAAGTVVATGELVHVRDARSASGIRSDLVERFNAGSALFVPIKWRPPSRRAPAATPAEEVRYVMILIRPEPGGFTDEEIELAQLLAGQAAAGLAREEVERRSAAQHDRDAALARAAKVLNASLDLQMVLETITREAGTAVGGDMAGVYLGDGVRGGVATAGHNTPEDWLGYVIKPGEGVGGQVLATGKAAISNAYQSDVRLPTNPGLRRLQTAVAVPMAWGGELRGALSIGFARMHRIGEDELRTLEAIADLAAVACRNAETFQRIESASRMDSLTGLLDHGALQGRLREEIARARREGGTLSVVMLDLDEFEALNEQAGHLHGDDVLCRVASLLRRSFRPYDGVARYGGDEFVVLLPRCGTDEALELCERLRRVLTEVAVPAGAARLDASIGIVGWQDPSEAGELLDQALAAMRAAKRAGKGRVVVR